MRTQLATLVALVGLAGDASAQFQGLGDLPGGAERSIAAALSADGTTAVGSSDDSSGSRSFIWTNATGMQPLPLDFDATGVDASGAAMGGTGPAPSIGGEAVRWTTAGQAPLGFLAGGDYSNGFGISADGNTVVGRANDASGTLPVRWTPGGGLESLGLAAGTFSGSAEAASGDGAVIAGTGSFATGQEATRWTQATGNVGLGHLAGAAFPISEAFGISKDGTAIVGRSESQFGTEAFRWTQAGGMEGLGDLPGGVFFSHAAAASEDGSVIVGAGFDALGSQAVRWSSGGSPTKLASWLTAQGLDVTGWTLEYANGISADGRVILGTGKNPQGKDEAWIAVLPAAIPALTWSGQAVLMTAFATMGLLRIQRS
jgi:probable HAF family extracellular repeat protein